MTVTRLAAGLIALSALTATAAPALADAQTDVCVIATNNRNNPGPPALCVWAPVGQPATGSR